jgi:DNA (cytosine-5)-methyltransferase 1
MENVKGILTSRIAERHIFQTITSDLKRPDKACGTGRKVEYVLVALPSGSGNGAEPQPEDFIVQAERFGVPQARHRVIILGVRRDVYERVGSIGKLGTLPEISVGDVIDDLPELRPKLSYRGGALEWRESLELPIFAAAIAEMHAREDLLSMQVASHMEDLRVRMNTREDPGSGADRRFVGGHMTAQPAMLGRWYRDRASSLLANHESRSHMPSDLVRYLFVSTFGKVTGESPRLSDFPPALLPEHKNVDRNDVANSIFKDRFRVQLSNRCGMTVTSHIGKDGHAFIHPDPTQCRTLTVREAARLQTFPDSYVFLGNRTSQYTQVGNAVPPYLAWKIASIVGDVLLKFGDPS